MLLYCRVKYFELIEQIKVVFLYYRSWKYALLDITFLSFYFWRNPYRIARKFYQKQGAKNIHCYGETPLTTLEKVASELDLQPSDTFIELGCGRARSCFWISIFYPCKVIGIDWIAKFTIPAEVLRKWFRLKFLTIVCDDYHNLDFSNITAAYLYGTDLSDKSVHRIAKKLETMKEGSRLVSISYPIESDHFELISEFSVRFNWGKTTAYLQKKSTKLTYCFNKEPL